MINKIIEILEKYFQEETLASRSQRMIPAAVYGFLIATTYVVTLSFVNVYTFPNLPLGMDWGRMFEMWIGFGLALALFGTIAAWFTEEAAGIVGGGVVATLLLGVVFLSTPGDRTGTSTFQSIIMALTLAGVNLLAAWGLRWTANRHLKLTHEEAPALRRKQLTRHILILILIGMIPGVLGRMDLSAEQTLGQLHELLQTAPTDPSVRPQLPLRQVPNLEQHFGVEYVIYPRLSAISAGALDVVIRFEDGFSMACFLPISSGTSFITQCSEGEKFIPGP